MDTGGDFIDCAYNVSSPSVSMPNSKIHINSIISDAHIGDRYLGIEISNFYLSTNVPYHQYMQVHPSKILKEIWDEYDINIAPDGFVYFKICKGMNKLKEVDVLEFKILVEYIAPHG